jgi:hypothetical protein
MNLPVPKKAHILFLFSDTGAGHRRGAQAIIEALNLIMVKGISRTS